MIAEQVAKKAVVPSYMKRRLVPPGLAYFDLLPGPGIAPFWKGIASLLGFAPKTPIADGPVGLTMMRHTRLRRAAIQIVPWGVITAVAHGWDEIIQIVHESVEQMAGTNDNGWPHMKSFVYVDIGAERFQAVADFQPSLEDLPKLVRGFAAEAERPIALDIQGEEHAEPQNGDVFRRLLRAARMVSKSEVGRDLFDVATGDYRTTMRVLRREGLQLLKKMLVEHPGHADPAPLAAILAGELHAEELVPDLLPMLRSPCPLTAATCRAAALRLGHNPRSLGNWRQLRAFLEDGEVRAMEAWSQGAQV